jgi:molybdopterin-guanine dinucleotide biosynthesis protein A
MGGDDKGLMRLAGRPLVAHVIDALAPQVGRILINTNRHEAQYAALGYPVIGDTIPGHPGPLAGLLSAMEHVGQGLVLAVPCDTPLLPPDLVPRLRAALEPPARLSTVHDGERLQPAILLAPAALAPTLRAALERNENKVEGWVRSQPFASVDFSDCPQAFANINTPEQLTALERRLETHHE